jgi:hypothetical protein
MPRNPRKPKRKKRKFTEADIKNASLAELERQDIPLAEILKHRKFSAKQLKSAGYRSYELRWHYDARQMLDAGYSIRSLIAFRYPLDEIIVASDAKRVMSALPEGTLKAAKFSASHVLGVLGLERMLKEGYTILDLRVAGKSALELRKAGVDLYYLRQAGFPVGELKPILEREIVGRGSRVRILKTLVGVGFTVPELSGVGYSYEQLKTAGFDDKQLGLAKYFSPKKRNKQR